MDKQSTQSTAADSKRSSGRRTAPRLGAFVTIAVALLLLFGAASRVGKVQETVALFGIDSQAENRIRHEEERLRTALMIGSAPARRDEVLPQTGVVGIDPQALPPRRSDFDIDSLRNAGERSNSSAESGLTLSIPHNYENNGGAEEQPSYQSQPAPNRSEPSQSAKTYKVKNGDTWVKIAKQTLGDANRWREIMSVNPGAQNGLRVGMELRIPNGG